jgi:hypothetical protein
MNSAIKGRAREHKSRDRLTADGYTMLRCAGSKGHGWDLCGWRADGWVLVSVKSAEWPSPSERQRLADVVVPPGTRKLILRWRDRARQPDVREL